MKKDSITCDVILDLLPLYEDECCSEQSRRIVEEHLKECRTCGKKYLQYDKKLPQLEEAQLLEAKKIQCGIKKIYQWKIKGIVALCLALIIVFAVLPAWNYINGEGITYTNLKAVQMGYSFEKALASGDYEKAYSYLDIKGKYNDLLETSMTSENFAVMEGIQEIEANGFEWYNEAAKEKFMENMKTLEEMDEMVNSYSKFRITSQPFGWCVEFESVKTASNQEFEMHLDIYPDGIRNFSVSINDVQTDSITGEQIRDAEVEQKELMLSRFYSSPTINETVMEILYDKTEYEWENFFEY